MTATERILESLTRQIGLDPASLGVSAVTATIQERMRVLDLVDPESYRAKLASDPREWQNLTERLVVPETWFFRGPGLFDYLARTIRDAVQADPTRTVRILSIPCSTGEEPYSLAIALRERRVPPERYTILGVDLSESAIASARRGFYREFAFRQILPAIRTCYFAKRENTWAIAESIQSQVQFHVGNLLESDGGASWHPPFDIILCRNLLIYFTPETRRRAIDQIERLLLPGGLLAVGSAETSALVGRSFEPTGASDLFLFQHTDSPKSDRMVPVFPEPRHTRGSVILAPPLPRQIPPAVAPVPTPRPIPTIPSAEPSLERARQLADTGQLAEAQSVCQAAMDRTPTASGYALLGVVLHALGRLEEATDALRRALYLEPNHREALIHALTVALASGQSAQAEIFRTRLRKLPPEERL